MGYVLLWRGAINTIIPAWLVDVVSWRIPGENFTCIAFLGIDPFCRKKAISIDRELTIATLYRSIDGYLLPNKQVEPGN